MKHFFWGLLMSLLAAAANAQAFLVDNQGNISATSLKTTSVTTAALKVNGTAVATGQITGNNFVAANGQSYVVGNTNYFDGLVQVNSGLATISGASGVALQKSGGTFFFLDSNGLIQVNSANGLAAVNVAGTVSATGLQVAGTVTVTAGLLNTANISATGNLSVTTINGSVPIFSGAPSWYSITAVPTVLQNISNSTGSVTVTSINAAVATLTSIGAGSLTASGIVSANVLDSFILSTTAINGSNATLTGGLTTGSIAASGIVSAAILSGTSLYTLNISNSAGLLTGTLSSTGVVSASSGYANVMHEGVLAVDATSASTALNLSIATLISSTISSNTTVAFSGGIPTTAQVVLWKVCQDTTGGRTINYPATARFNANTSPTLTTTGLTCSLLTLSPLPGSANILVGSAATGVSN